jgi:biopolymer transport protein ExbD
MRVKKFDSINVVPFIDIMLVLLVIVLTTASFVAKGIIPIDLSSASSAKKLDKPQTLDISIKDGGEIYFDDKQISKSAILQKLLAYKKDATISIATDKSAKMDHFIHILDLLKSNNFTNISIVTKLDR